MFVEIVREIVLEASGFLAQVLGTALEGMSWLLAFPAFVQGQLTFSSSS